MIQKNTTRSSLCRDKAGIVRRNLALEIEYEGTNYCGWQIQQKRRSIQEVIEKALQKVLREKVKLTSSGRTDAGVHALAQIAHFQTKSAIPLERLQVSLNALLPHDISICKIKEKDADFHSRFNAQSKIYRYSILNRRYRSAFLRNRVYFCPWPLNISLMQKEARVLVGRHNFKSFQTTDTKDKDPIRTVKGLKISKNRDIISIDIEADGFLYNMVRSIVGTLIEIGRGKFPAGSLKKILRAKDRRMAGPTAPACGLCLIKVKYCAK